MKILAFALASTCLFASAAQADTTPVYNTSLANLNGPGVTTTTDANGTVTTSSGARVTAPPAVNSWFQSEVGGGGSVGITKTYTNDANGAAYFSTTDGNSKGDLQYYFSPSTPITLASLSSVSFDFFRDAASTTQGIFAPVLRLDIRKDGAFAGSLVLEDYYQDHVNPVAGVWTNVSADLSNGIFWATNTALGPKNAAANGGQKSLQSWLDANSGSTLTVSGLSIGVGSGWNGGTFSGALDHVAYDFGSGNATTFDFQVADSAVPEPATWAMMIGGFGMIGGAMRRRTAKLATA